ncbi:MAG TPA: winged helix-turn-helix domain-containing protein [Methanomicrobiales archaeon]|nr:winged helix-turn-helix domain-containing protein [Methanomicrobiales archaeon]
MPDGTSPAQPPATGGVVILEPGDEKAQKIAKAIASRTAGEILQLLKEGGQASTQIADALKIPITTVQYHLENLVDAGVITIVEKRWSQKGREVKVYGLRDQMLIVVPRGGDLKGILLRYGSLFAVVVLASLMLAILGPAFAPGVSPALQATVPSALPRGSNEAGGVADHLYKGAANESWAPNATPVTQMTQPAPEMATQAPVLPPLPLVFFLGGVLVIAVMLGYELWVWRKGKTA